MLVDTGSSWNWVMSCNKNVHRDWAKKLCPYFDESQSSSLSSTGQSKTITYGGNATVGGPVYEENLMVYGSREMTGRLPIILSR
jgi:hypothetical protein